MVTCTACGGENHPERVELGIGWCLQCALDNPVLARPQFGVLGVHKSSPIVVAIDSSDWQRRQSYMVR